MTGLENHAHPTLAHLVEDEIIADQEAMAFILVNRGGLIGGELAGLDERAREPHHVFGGVDGEPLELGRVDQADLGQRGGKLTVARDLFRLVLRTAWPGAVT